MLFLFLHDCPSLIRLVRPGGEYTIADTFSGSYTSTVDLAKKPKAVCFLKMMGDWTA
jgi:hypothetical protein